MYILITQRALYASKLTNRTLVDNGQSLPEWKPGLDVVWFFSRDVSDANELVVKVEVWSIFCFWKKRERQPKKISNLLPQSKLDVRSGGVVISKRSNSRTRFY